MTRFAALLLAALIALPGMAAAAGTWTVGPAPSDNPDLEAASVTNADGHTVYVWLLTSDAARASQLFCELHLAEGTEFAGIMPIYRIDDAAVVDTAEIRAAGEAQDALWGHVGERVAFWLIAPVPSDVPAHQGALRSWLDGEALTVTFRTAGGIEQTTRFSLTGSRQAISGATGIALD